MYMCMYVHKTIDIIIAVRINNNIHSHLWKIKILTRREGNKEQYDIYQVCYFAVDEAV